MAITPVTAPLPTENAEPWIGPRNLLDNQLKATANAAAAGVDALEAAKGAASGIAQLGADSKLLPAQLPALAVTEYLGPAATQAAMLALVGQQGDWTTRTDLGTVFVITGADPTQLGSWTQLTYPTAPVTSVAGKTGAVTLVPADVGAATAAQGSKADTAVQPADLTKAAVGLGNVDNTSDANKPVSGPQQTALDGKVPTSRTVAGHALTADVARAGLNTLGVVEGIFLPSGTPVPGSTPIYSVIIEA